MYVTRDLRGRKEWEEVGGASGPAPQVLRPVVHLLSPRSPLTGGGAFMGCTPRAPPGDARPSACASPSSGGVPAFVAALDSRAPVRTDTAPAAGPPRSYMR